MYSIDVQILLMGAVANDGGLGTTLVSPGDIVENTVKLNSGDAQRTSFSAIGKSAPVWRSKKAGEIPITFDIMTFDLEVMADLLGGTVSGTAPNQFWNAPIGNAPIIERTIEVLDGEGMTFQFPRVDIDAKLIGEFSTSAPNVIRVMGMVMQPTKAGVSHMSYGKKA